MAKEKKEIRSKSSPASGKGLGKGLGALLGAADIQLEPEFEKVLQLDIQSISPMANQPRKVFDQDKLTELSQSIAVHGVLQPIIVTRDPNTDYYTLVAGERRWRAARLAGLTTIPAIVRKLDEHLVLQHAIIENIQREDLNPVEEARAFVRLMDQHNMTQEELSEVLGRSRSAIANTVRLIQLPDSIIEDLERGMLTQGHARTLLGLPTPEMQCALAERIKEEALNVRQTEKIVRDLLNPPAVTAGTKEQPDSAYLLSVQQVETELSKALGTKVQLKDRAGKGQIVIRYRSNDELQRIIDALK